MLPQDEILKLQERCEYLEATIIDILSTLIDNKEAGDDYPDFVGGDAQSIKDDFESMIKLY